MNPVEECIALATDEGYVAQACVVLASYALSNPRNRRDVFVFIDGVSENGAGMLRTTGAAFGLRLTLVALDGPMLKDIASQMTTGLTHVSSTVYAKLIIPTSLPETYKRCLILDCDILIRANLDGLFETDLEGYCLAAAVDGLHAEKSASRLGFPPGDSYFNSGIMLFDLQLWKKEKPLLSSTEEIGRFRKKIMYLEQDLFNLMFKGKFRILPPHWNAMIIIVPQGVVKNWKGAIEEQSILHFAGEIKPWHEFYHPEVRDLYLSYVRNCPWIQVPNLGPKGEVQRKCALILARKFGLEGLAAKYTEKSKA
jgi:lipopolysaccharide biosynthesis glycosyltransferase